jgi:multidrug resistance efflux pump
VFEYIRRINILYLAIPVVCWGLWVMFQNLNRGAAAFFGFAENNETSINLDHDLIVNRIFVKPGSFVKKGALLMEVTRTALDFKMTELNFSIAELESRDQWRAAEIKAKIEQLRAERSEKTGAIASEIRLLEAEYGLNQQVLRNLKSVEFGDTSSTSSSKGPYATQLATLREKLLLSVEPIDKEISTLEKEFLLSGVPEKKQVDKLKEDINFYKKEQERLTIYAPSDGLIGYVHCKEGENIAAFTTMISFYEQNPNMVIGYVHESLSLKVQVGDSLRVVSILHPADQCMGKVSGLGHRVVEIPERLRKIPELRSYGREVLIEIPANNRFLQKEKVQLQWPNLSSNPFRSFISQRSAEQ